MITFATTGGNNIIFSSVGLLCHFLKWSDSQGVLMSTVLRNKAKKQ